jgi:hypothetical protein
MLNYQENAEGFTQPFKKEGLETETADIFPLKKKRNSNGFRLNAKKFFLTYLRTTISRKDVLKQLMTIFSKNIKEYLICQETHNHDLNDDLIDSELNRNTLTSHIHAYICLNVKVNITSRNTLDLIDPNTSQRISGRYESVKNREFCINYCKKEDKNFLSNLEEDFELI